MTPEAAARRLGWYFALALGTSWAYWLAVTASSRGWIPVRVPLGPWGAFGPLLAAVVTARLLDGRAGVMALLRRTGRWRVGGRWYAVALLGPLAAFAIALLADRLAGNALPELRHLDQAWLLPLVVIAVLVLGGPLGEEVGWRAYALPLLLRLYPPLVSSVVLGAVWFAWHLPLFWMPGTSQHGGQLWPFAVAVMANSVLFTWLFLHTRGSGLLAILLHTSINTGYVVMGTALPELDTRAVYGYGVVAVFALAAAVAALAPGSGMRADAPEETRAA